MICVLHGISLIRSMEERSAFIEECEWGSLSCERTGLRCIICPVEFRFRRLHLWLVKVRRKAVNMTQTKPLTLSVIQSRVELVLLSSVHRGNTLRYSPRGSPPG